MSIGLLYQGRQLLMDPNPTIDWEYEDDPFDLDFIPSGHSWNMDLPIKGNEWAFGFASNPQTLENRFKSYDGFHITFDGNIWWSVTLELVRTNRAVTHYEVALSTIPLAIEAFKDSELSEIITAVIELPDIGQAPVDYNDVLDIDPDLYWPVIYAFSEDQVSAPRFGNAGSLNLLPCWTFNRLLKFIADDIGYELVGKFDREHILVGNRFLIQSLTNSSYNFFGVNNQLIVGEYLPKISLFNFIRSVSAINACRILIDEERKRIEIKRIIDTFDVSQAIDVTSQVGPNVQLETPDILNYEFKYNHIDKDEWLSMQEEELSGTFAGEFETIADWITAGLNDEEYVFIRTLNAYYKYTTAKDVHFYQDPFIVPYQTGSEKVKTIDIDLLPCHKTDFILYTVEDTFSFTDNGAGKLRITIQETLSVTLNFGNNVKVKFLEETPYEDRFYNVIGKDVNQRWWDLDVDFIEYTDANNDVQVFTTGRVRVGSPLGGNSYPMIGDQFQDLFGNLSGSSSFIPRYLNAHAKNYATSDKYRLDGSKSTTHFTAQFVQSGNLYEGLWEVIYARLSNIRKLIFDGHFSAFFLKKLITSGIGKYAHGFTRFRRIRTTLTNKGPRDQEIEGYKL